ncbi:MAG: RIO1 family regulatory kinase/ATPase [Candidatus Aenigmatarchaeota archaeon]
MFEEFEVFSKVFDETTLKALYYLRNSRILKGIVGIVKEGKESVVFSAKDFNNNWIAIKIYRILHIDFKQMYNLLIIDSRYKRIKRDRKNVVFSWCNREYRNLALAYKNKITVPKPLGSYANVLVMEFVGENGISAPLLKDVEPNYEIYKKIIENLKKLKSIGLSHGDLSEYNILVKENIPYFIDFSQGVREDSLVFEEHFKKDLENINKFFSKYLDSNLLVYEI